MSYERRAKEIGEELFSFRECISLSGYAPSILEDAILSDPRVLVYVGEVHPEYTAGGFGVRVRYANTEIDRENVEFVKNGEDAEGLMQFYVSRCRDCLVLVAPQGVDLVSAYEKFALEYTTFYSAWTGTKLGSARWEQYRFQALLIRFSYRISRYRLRQMDKQLNGELDAVCRKIFRPGMSALEKAYIAHNYLARTVTYWLKEDATPDESAIMQSAYGALVEHKCVCQGFAEAYKRLLDTQGIDCHVLCGKVKGSTVHHAWNLLTVDGKERFHVDVTWDSFSTGRVSDRYFGVSDASFLKERHWTRKPEWIADGATDWAKRAKEEIRRHESAYLGSGVERQFLLV